jgi:MarR family transcriptional repressor of emrRAB
MLHVDGSTRGLALIMTTSVDGPRGAVTGPTAPGSADASPRGTGDVLLAVTHLLWQRLHEHTRVPADAAALNLALHQPGLSISHLAAQLGLSHSATVRLVDRLTAQGLLRRRAGTGRVVHIHLTAAGRRVATTHVERTRRLVNDALDPLGPDSATVLTGLLTHVARSLALDQADADRACRRCDQTRCAAEGCPLDPLEASDEPATR